MSEDSKRRIDRIELFPVAIGTGIPCNGFQLWRVAASLEGCAEVAFLDLVVNFVPVNWQGPGSLNADFHGVAIDPVDPPGFELRLWIIGYHRSIETSSNMRPVLGFRRYDGSTKLRDMVTADSADPLTSEAASS